MDEKRQYNKIHPEEYRLKKLAHEKERELKADRKKNRKLKKVFKDEKRNLKKAYRNKEITKEDYQKAIKKLKDILEISKGKVNEDNKKMD